MSYQFELVIDIKRLEEQNKFIRQGILSFNDSFMGRFLRFFLK
ncbi:Acetyltransferase [Legionella beliardensis]|uniref:Acetyltransferase n=1 Tax=Legionella beliardensis TaxID=91822 RepID=A0A378I3C5_9GAMM|nr:Acetyltransferase [Legionella beliardensis]